MSNALILFAHGARDARWSGPFEAVAEHIRSARPNLPVRLAFLEFMSPTLPQAGAELVALGCERIDVLPMFLGAGGHVRKDLPLLMQGLSEQHPGIQFTLHAAVGEMASVVAAMALAALTRIDGQQ